LSQKIKILIFIVIVVLLLPLGYKEYINKTVISRINSLSDKGFIVSKGKDEGGYFSVVRSYKLIMSNPDTVYDKFLSPLFNSTQKAMLKKAFSSLNGSEITVDLNILNFPVLHKGAISVYLTSLPSVLSSKLQKNLSLQEISNFLKNKGFGESIDINALGKITSIKMKDIDKQFDTQKGNLSIKLKDDISDISRYDLYHYDYAFKMTNRLFDLKIISNTNDTFALGYKNLKCNIDRKSLYDSKLLCNLDELHLKSTKYKERALKLDGIFLSSDSSLDKNSIDSAFKYKIKNIDFKSKSKYRKDNMAIKNFVYAGNLTGIDKNILDKISKIPYNNSKTHSAKQYIDILQQVVNNGFVFDLTKLAIDSMKTTINGKTIPIGAITIGMNLKLEKNNINLLGKRKFLEIVKYVTINATIQMKKRDFAFFNTLDRRKKMSRISKMVKYQGDDAIFDIKFAHSSLSINNQKVF